MTEFSEDVYERSGSIEAWNFLTSFLVLTFQQPWSYFFMSADLVHTLKLLKIVPST